RAAGRRRMGRAHRCPGHGAAAVAPAVVRRAGRRQGHAAARERPWRPLQAGQVATDRTRVPQALPHRDRDDEGPGDARRDRRSQRRGTAGSGRLRERQPGHRLRGDGPGRAAGARGTRARRPVRAPPQVNRARLAPRDRGGENAAMTSPHPIDAERYPLLAAIDAPADLRRLQASELRAVADELRAYLIECVGHSGGHFGAGLGVVELTTALHYLYDTPHDRIVWDVGHQAYPHKILTGRRDGIRSVKQAGGIAPFPKREESEYDTFGVGHSSTSISAALGMAVANKLIESARAGNERKVVAVIGDGAMTAGMAYEALNHAGGMDPEPDILVILNDNRMS